MQNRMSAMPEVQQNGTPDTFKTIFNYELRLHPAAKLTFINTGETFDIAMQVITSGKFVL